MRELFYRRDDKGVMGYKIAAAAPSITAKERASGTDKTLPAVDAGARTYFTYKQFCMDGGTLVVSAGYLDPHGSRGSGFAHVLLTDGDDEREALLDACPTESRYFRDFLADYTADESLLDPGKRPLEASLKAYVGAGGAAMAPEILRRTFGSEELLGKVFEALLDAASANPRMVVVALEGASMEELPEQGRRIAEALFACLPPVVAASLGYQSPAVDLNDVAFPLRFTANASLLNHAMVYGVSASGQTMTLPPNRRFEVGEYAAFLARAVMAGTDAAFNQIRSIRRRLSDWTLFGSQNYAADMALRYAFYTRCDALTPEEVRTLLDWRHAAVETAVRGDVDALDRTPFWADVDEWLKSAAIPKAFEDPDGGDADDPLRDAAIRRTLFTDAQALFELGRSEADFFGGFFAQKMGEEAMCAEADKPILYREVKEYFCARVGEARNVRFKEKLLYWDGVEDWIHRQWQSGALPEGDEAVAAIGKLYEMDPEGEAAAVDVYADRLADASSALYSSDDSAFREAAVQQFRRQAPEAFAARMARELNGQNPFRSDSAMRRVRWYQAHVRGDAELEASLSQHVEAQLDATVDGYRYGDLEALLGELRGGELLNKADQLGVRGRAVDDIKQRAVSLAGSEGFYAFYPDRPDVARQIAELIDQSAPHARASQRDRLETLERVRALDADALTDDDVDRYVSDCDRNMDGRQRRIARDLLWQSVKAAYGDRKNRDYAPLLRALMMRAYDGGAFDAEAILKDVDKLEISDREFRRCCAKNAGEALEGVEYIAEQLRRYASAPEDEAPRSRRRYPGQRAEREAPERSRGRGASSWVDDEDDDGEEGAFDGIPMAAPLVGAAVFGVGFIASAIGLIKIIGLL